MAPMLKKLLNFSGIESEESRQEKLHSDLIRHEAKIGGTLFGPTQDHMHREFFCLDEHTWVWHEEWRSNGEQKVRTTKYNVRPRGVVKSQNGSHYQKVSDQEAIRLLDAARAYKSKVNREIYNLAA